MVLAVALAGYHLGDVMLRRWHDPRPPADSGIADLASWREICDWAANHTPPEALFITPRTAQTFRWYAGRAEVVSRKDIPQDAAGIVEWWRRMNDVYGRRQAGTGRGWYNSLTERGSPALLQLGEKYSADYVITDARPPLALELVSPPNRTYAVYRLPH